MIRRYGLPAGIALLAVALAGCGAPPSDRPDESATPTTSAVEPSTSGSPVPSGPAPSGPTSSPPSSGASGPATGPSTPAPSGSSGASSGSAGSAPTSAGDVDLSRYQPETSWQQALATAREKFDGRPTSVELGWERDGLVYTVELVSDSQEYEAEIAAGDGRVLAESTDSLDDEEARSAQQEVIDTPGIVAVADAMAAATESTPGRVVEWKLAKNHRGVYYEFDIVNGTGSEDTEVHVDATTGEVIS